VCIPANTWFLGLAPVNTPNGVSIGSAVFAQRHTDHATSTRARLYAVPCTRCGPILLTGFVRPTSATPRDHGDGTSGRQDTDDENDGGHVDDVTDALVVIGAVSIASC